MIVYDDSRPKGLVLSLLCYMNSIFMLNPIALHSLSPFSYFPSAFPIFMVFFLSQDFVPLLLILFFYLYFYLSLYISPLFSFCLVRYIVNLVCSYCFKIFRRNLINISVLSLKQVLIISSWKTYNYSLQGG